MNGKVKAAVSRKTVLENELKDIKADYEKNKKILIEKSTNDDKYIEALKNEYEKIKKLKQGDTRVIYKNNCDHEHKEPH